MNEMIKLGSLYRYLVPLVCWIVCAVAAYDFTGKVRNRVLRIGLAVLIASGLTAISAVLILDRQVFAWLATNSAVIWRLRRAFAFEFIAVWILIGALLTAVQRKEEPLSIRLPLGFTVSFFVTHFVISALRFFY